ncbi:MAG: DinB family protein, partial [Vicinamibacterales bacterium]
QLVRIAVFACALTALATPSFAQVSLKEEMLKDWASLQNLITGLANEMPADKYNAKPTEPQQTFGERVVHVAVVNNRFLGMVGGTAKAPELDPKTAPLSKDAALKALTDSFAYGTALLNELNDQTLLQAVASPPQFLGPSTKARIFNFLNGHTWDTYGQLVVYLRLNGGVPPASQRP